MTRRTLLTLLCLTLLPLAARAQGAEERFIVVTETHSLDAASNNEDDGPGTIDGTHVMRYVAPAGAKLKAMRVGEQVVVKLHDVSGGSSVQAEKAYYDSRTKTSPTCPSTYAADLRVDKGGGPGLFIKRTAAGFELATYPYAEYFVHPFEACAGVAYGSCAFVFDTPMVFRVSLDDVEKLDRVRGSYHGKGDWNEGEARMCNGTVTATLNGDLVPDDDVTVEGPGCVCNDDPKTFTATAKTGGGSFDRWEVEAADGDKPHVLSNTGGEVAKLVLYGDGKKTGATTVTVAYRKKGKTFRSRPKTIHFCKVEKPKLKANVFGNNLRDFAFNEEQPGRVEVPLEGEAWLDAKDVWERLRWDVAPNPGGLLAPDSAQGGRVVFKAVGLPANNDDFGARDIKARMVEGGCDCASESVEVRLFFQRDEKNNPGHELPNWAYYWKQTGAGRDAWGKGASFRVVDRVPPTRGALDDARAVGRYDPYTDTLYLAETLLDVGCCDKPGGGRNEGIDCFAETIWHEGTHRMELTSWWGSGMARYPQRCSDNLSAYPVPLPLAPPVVVVCPEDLDMDWVPDDIDCMGLHADPACKALPSCNAVKVGHIEMHAYDVGRSWKTGSLKSKDWAYPGSQWPARK